MKGDSGFIDLGDYDYADFDPNEFNKELDRMLGFAGGTVNGDRSQQAKSKAKENWGKQVGDDLVELAEMAQDAISDCLESQRVTQQMVENAAAQYRQVVDGGDFATTDEDGTTFDLDAMGFAGANDMRRGVHDLRQQAGALMDEADRQERYLDLEGGF